MKVCAGVHGIANASTNIQIRLENQHEAKGCQKCEHFISGYNNHASVLACLILLGRREAKFNY